MVAVPARDPGAAVAPVGGQQLPEHAAAEAQQALAEHRLGGPEAVLAAQRPGCLGRQPPDLGGLLFRERGEEPPNGQERPSAGAAGRGNARRTAGRPRRHNVRTAGAGAASVPSRPCPGPVPGQRGRAGRCGLVGDHLGGAEADQLVQPHCAPALTWPHALAGAGQAGASSTDPRVSTRYCTDTVPRTGGQELMYVTYLRPAIYDCFKSCALIQSGSPPEGLFPSRPVHSPTPRRSPVGRSPY
jgi:hypothetical protein